MTGLTGALTLVLGAAWPEEKCQPIYSTKNWLFVLGALFMLGYASLNYFFAGGFAFFILLECLIIIASILMMMDVSDRINTIVISLFGLALVAIAIYLGEDSNTFYFIVGLIGVGFGYAFKMGTIRRFLALVIGSTFISVFSYFAGDMIFFALNAFFALFSAYYLVKILRKS